MFKYSVNFLVVIFLLTLLIFVRYELANSQTSNNITKNDIFEYLPCSKIKPEIDELHNWEGVATAKEVFEQTTRTAKEGDDYRCAYLTVPEQHSQPDGKKIKLAVAIIESTTSSSPAEPLVILTGGPGGSAISNYASWADPKNETGRKLRQNNKLIILEQRGTLFSRPALMCQEINQLIAKTHLETFEQLETQKKFYSAVSECRKKLINKNINITAFNSLENADDIVFLAKALKTEKINVYASSYGTRLAFHVLNRHPQILGKIILDAVYPLEIDSSKEKIYNIPRLFNKIFRACSESQKCLKDYGDIKVKFFKTFDRLNKSPVEVTLRPIINNEPELKLILNGEIMAIKLWEISQKAFELIPALIYQLENEKYEFLEATLSKMYENQQKNNRESAKGMYLSVMCGENDYQNFEKPKHESKSYKLKLIYYNLANNGNTIERKYCQIWNVPKLDIDLKQPYNFDEHILFLNGNFDHITPPTYAHKTAQNFTHKWIVDFPREGHGVINNSCATAIAVEFLKNPKSSPDTSCIQKAKNIFWSEKSRITFNELLLLFFSIAILIFFAIRLFKKIGYVLHK